LRIDTAEFVRSTVAGSGPLGDGSPEIAFVGRSNVGKSSLLNRLLGRKLARTSSTPGRTRTLNWFRINRRFWFVDLPGYGFARTSRDEREEWAAAIDAYLRGTTGSRMVVHLVDAKVGATRLDEEAARYLAGLGVERLVVATKIDRLKRGERARRLVEIGRALGLAGGTEEVLPVSALSGEGVRELWKRVAEFLAGSLPSQKGKEEQHAEGDGSGSPGG
jgi:GTP-binding protein